MLKKHLKVAIYSGASKSTTFIERLIAGLANAKVEVLVFGANKGKPHQSSFVKYHVYGGKTNKIVRLVKYGLLLSIYKKKEKKQLDTFISSRKGSKHNLQLKYYPVLYHKPDVFHLQWAKSIADWVWVKDFGIELIVSLRGAHINYSPIANEVLAETYKKLFPLVDGFHAVSNAIAKESLKYHSNKDKVQVIYSGLDLDVLSFHQKKKNAKNTLQILSIGRAHWKKGYRYALDVMTLLKENGIDFQYTIIGVKQDEALMHQRHEAGLYDCVTFLDALSFDKVKTHITSADVLLLPSIEEGIANVVLEAMALGTLVVSTDCGGMKEVITDGENGLLVPVRDIEIMADNLMKVYEMSSATYLSMTKKARMMIEDRHTDKQMISSFVDFYNKVKRLN